MRDPPGHHNAKARSVEQIRLCRVMAVNTSPFRRPSTQANSGGGDSMHHLIQIHQVENVRDGTDGTSKSTPLFSSGTSHLMFKPFIFCWGVPAAVNFPGGSAKTTKAKAILAIHVYPSSPTNIPDINDETSKGIPEVKTRGCSD